MLPGNMMRVLCAVAGVAMVLAGCTGCPPTNPVDCTQTTITFLTPTADQTVDSPFEVTADVTAPDGSTFGIQGAQLSISGGAPIDGVAEGNRATFTGVTASPGAQKLKVTIRQGSCSKSSAELPIVVRDACSTAKVTAVSFPQDANTNAVLNRSELPPGTDLQVKVDAACVSSGVQVRIKRGPTEVSSLTSFVNGSATITLAGIPAADNERVDLFAELVSNGVAINTEGGNPEARGSIQVTRGLPSCTLAVPAMCLGPNADADNMLAGFQLRLTGTMAMGSTGSITLDSQPPVSVTPSMTGDVSADFTLASSGTFMGTITCTDAAGNTNTATGSYCVDFTPPTVSITSPATVDGGATMVVTQSPLPVTIATDAEDGSLVEVLRNGMTAGSATVSGGVATVDVPFSGDGTFTLTVRVTDRSGNVATASLVVTVALSGCGGAFAAPMVCPALLTQTQMPSGTYTFQTQSKSQCVGQGASLFRADVTSDGGVGAEVASGTTTLTAAGRAIYAPLMLTSGDYFFRGEVVNPGPDAGVSNMTCRVTVDLEGPAITNPVVPTGQTFATINAAQDTQPGTNGVQRVLTFSARVPVGGHVDVCTTQALNPYAPIDGGFQTRPTSPECGSGWFVLQNGVTSPVNGFTFPDGSYEVKVVVVGGGLAVAPASSPVAVFVDSIRPCVDGLTRSLPQDLNGDMRLSLAELAGGQPQLVFGLHPICSDTSPATLAASGAVTVRDIVGGVPGAVRSSTATFANGLYTVTLSGTYASEVDLDLFIELTDLASNKNQLQTPDPGRFTFRVDPVAPVCSITSPSAALLGIAQVPGGDLDVIVATSADVSTNGVNVTFTGFPARQLTPVLSQAPTTYALTGDSSYTIGATCTDQSGNVSTASARTTRVDLVPPTCNITAPVNNTASSVNDITSTVAVTGLVDNDLVTLASTVAGITNNVLTVTGTSATRVVHYANGAQTVTASATDAAGNACVAPTGGRLSIALTVNSTSCNLDFNGGTVITNPRGSWINRVSAANPGGTSPATVSIGAVTSDCGAGRNVYLYQGAPSATPSGTPQVTNAGGTVAFAGTAVSDGQQWTITIDNGAGVLTHRSFLVSFAMPSITSIGLQRSSTVPTIVPIAPNAALIFGAASGNRRVETATATDMVFADLDGASADAQFQLTLTGIDGARAGGLNADLEVLEGTTALMATMPVTAAPFTPALPRMQLAHRIDDTTTTLIIRVTSPAGNVLTSTHSSEVDVIAPSAPAVTQTLTSARAATVGLSWAPVYDDAASAASGGLTGGSPVAGYDVRWTTSSVASNNSMAAESDYFGAASNPDGITGWSASTINKALVVPPINSYFVVVRARDEVGNYSTFSAPTSLSNGWTTVALNSPVASNLFGRTVAVSPSLNGDSVSDIVVSAPGQSGTGAVYVHFGSAGLSSRGDCPADGGCQLLTPPDLAPGSFGEDVAVGLNVGDVAAEQRSDLVVSQIWTTAGNNFGRVMLYFGSATAALDPAQAIEFRGDSTVAANRIGTGVVVVPSPAGSVLGDIGIIAPFANNNRGRIYFYRGRSRAAWATLRTATDPVSMAPYIPVNLATADYYVEGPFSSPQVNNAFGRNRYGFISLPDMTGDGRADLAIPTSRPSINRYQLYSGAAVGETLVTNTDGGALPVVELSIAAQPGSTTLTEGLGASSASLSLYPGTDTIADLVTSYPYGGQLLIYENVNSSLPTGPAARLIQGPVTFGTKLSLGTVNSNDVLPDILAGQNAFTSNEAWLLFQNAGRYDGQSGGPALGAGPLFWVSRFVGASITGTTNTMLGASNALGDVDGDSQVDVLLGDERTGTVRIWR